MRDSWSYWILKYIINLFQGTGELTDMRIRSEEIFQGELWQAEF